MGVGATPASLQLRLSDSLLKSMLASIKLRNCVDAELSVKKPFDARYVGVDKNGKINHVSCPVELLLD